MFTNLKSPVLKVKGLTTVISPLITQVLLLRAGPQMGAWSLPHVLREHLHGAECMVMSGSSLLSQLQSLEIFSILSQFRKQSKSSDPQ